MHELSIVQSIVEIAAAETMAAKGSIVEEIELDIGTLSGIEMNAFWFAWDQAVKDTMLAKAKAIVHTIEGSAKCMMCETTFPISHYSDPCPNCGSHFIAITHGKELSVKAITIA